MAFCINCGAKLPDGAKFCPDCGAKVSAPQAAQASIPPSYFDAQGSSAPVTMDDLFVDPKQEAQPAQETRRPSAEPAAENKTAAPEDRNLSTEPAATVQHAEQKNWNPSNDAKVKDKTADSQVQNSSEKPEVPSASEKPAKSIVSPAPVEATRAKTKKKSGSGSASWVPIVIIILIFLIALVIGIFKFRDILFGKEVVAGPGEMETTTTETTETEGTSDTAELVQQGETTGETAEDEAAAGAEQTADGSGMTAAAEEDPTPADETKTYPTWALTKENINVRNGAGTGFDKKGKFYRGTIVVLYEEKTADDLTWYRVSKDGAKTEQWIADDGTWLDFADPSAAAIIGEDLDSAIAAEMQFTMIAGNGSHYIWRFTSSENKEAQQIVLQNITAPADIEYCEKYLDTDSGYDFLIWLWEQNDHKVVELKEITLAGYCRRSGTDADGNAFAESGVLWYAVTGSRTANYFGTKTDDGSLKFEEVDLAKLYEDGWENCSEEEFKTAD